MSTLPHRKGTVSISPKAARAQRTLKLIANPEDENIYSMELERQLITADRLAKILETLNGESHYPKIIIRLVDWLRDKLKVKRLRSCIFTK